MESQSLPPPGPTSRTVSVPQSGAKPASVHPTQSRPTLRTPSLTSILTLAAALWTASGCVHRAPTPPLAKADTSSGYYFHTHPRTNNSSDTLLVLCFSGGGTRAAALSYGVLEELGRIQIGSGPRRRRLLDEVDAISSVSGGSITAGAYAAFGDNLFAHFEESFLKQDIQGKLLRRTLNPFHWNRLFSKTYGRSDIAAELYDQHLFRGLTFGDLAQRPGPYAVINATDISTGARFSFTQYQFDLICADLTGVRLSQAIAASSAVPGLLSPVTLNNRAGDCDAWIPNSAAARELSSRIGLTTRGKFHAREMTSYLDSTRRPFLHLVDGGVSDNLGVRAILDGLFAIEANPGVRDLFDMNAVRRVAVVVVNAYSSPEKDWDRREQPPGTLAIAISGASIPMDRYSAETLNVLREQIDRWREVSRENRADSKTPELQFFPIEISFSAIPDAADRRYFLNLPTSFRLKDEAIDKLRSVAGRLLHDSPEFQAFLGDMDRPPDLR